MLPENCGCVQEDNAFRIKWFEGDMLPTNVEFNCQDQEDDDAYSNDEDDRRKKVMEFQMIIVLLMKVIVIKTYMRLQ